MIPRRYISLPSWLLYIITPPISSVMFYPRTNELALKNVDLSILIDIYCLLLFCLLMFYTNRCSSEMSTLLTSSSSFSMSSRIMISFLSSSTALLSSSFFIECLDYKRWFFLLLEFFSVMEECCSCWSRWSLKLFSMLSITTTFNCSCVSPPLAVMNSVVVLVSLSDF